MSLNHSPSVVINGLVMYYDMNNTQKSWKGAPTTNLVVTAPYTLTTYTACSGPVNADVVDATGQIRTVNRYTINTTGGTPRARIIATGLTAGVNYSYSVKIRYNGGTYAQTWYIDPSKGNPEGGVNNNTFTSLNTNSVYLGNGWYQLTATFNFATCPTGGAWANFGLTAPDATYLNQTFDAYDIQFEQSTIVTPYVAGTRSNTQAIVDLTNNNTLTATSLTYAADNTFSFNGSSSFLSVPNSSSLQVSDTFTINVWINATDLSTNRFGIFSTRTINTAGSWQIEVGVGSAGQRKIAVTGVGTWIWESANDVITTNTWHNICFVKPGNAIQGGSMYLNGNLLSPSVTTAYTILNNGDAKVIGQGTGGGQFFPGRIDTVSLYNRALTAAEVQQNFNALRGRYSL